MITVTSNYSESLKGFPDITIFNFNIALAAGSTLTSIDYIWGDNTKGTVKDLNPTQKKYDKIGTYNVIATITYVNNKQTKTHKNHKNNKNTNKQQCFSNYAEK